MMDPRLRSALCHAVSLLLLQACTANAEPLSGEVEVTEIPEARMILTYPADWYLAEENLTPNLSDPREVFSLGSFQLRPGGPNCAQIPSRALHDFESTDVFVTLQERSGGNPSGFDSRPDNFGPTRGSTDNVFYECLEPEERSDIRTMHWIWFTDQDRYFHVLVVPGRDAAADDVSAVWSTLDQLVIEANR